LAVPALYNFGTSQSITANNQGAGTGGPYLFWGDNFAGSVHVRIYKDNGTGTYVLLQTLTCPDAPNDFLINQRCYDHGSGFLVLGGINKVYLYKVVAGLFVLQDTYNPVGPLALIQGTAIAISGTNVVLLGQLFSTNHLICRYMTVNTGAFVFQQDFNDAALDNRGSYLNGTASFSGTHFVLGNSVTHALKCFELSGGLFTLVQTIPNVLFANVLDLGYLFIVPSPIAAIGYTTIFSFAGTWTLLQSINLPVFPGSLIGSAPYAFTSPTLGASVVLISGFWNGAGQDSPVQVAYLTGGAWVVYQNANLSPLISDNEGVSGSQSAFFMLDATDTVISIFSASPPPQVLVYLIGKKLYPCADSESHQSENQSTYRSPPGTFDLPFTWVFDASIFANGSAQPNSSVYLLGGYGDFLLRRVVGMNRILAGDKTGQFQIQRATKGSYIQSDPVMGENSPELAIAPEEWYPETGKIWFDLFGINQPTPLASSQIAFQGVRRQKGTLNRPKGSFNPKSYTYQVAATIDAIPGSPIVARTLIQDYDFELHQIMVMVKGPSGYVPVTTPVCTISVFDQNKVSISNKPVLDIFYNGAPGTPYQNGAIVPPLVYKKETLLQINFYRLT
jgi:hypothetical protein